MKKKVLVTTIFFIALIVLFSIIYKISLVQNIKKTLGIQTVKINAQNEITVIDVTELDSNINIEHEHVTKTVYDTNNHWEECIVCKEKQNIVPHTYIDNGWTLGTANNCYEGNKHKFSCKCGYSFENTTGRKSHNLISTNDEGNYYLHIACKECDSDLTEMGHRCQKNGRLINENNLGKCSICNYNYTKVWHSIWSFHPLVPFKLFESEILENLNNKSEFYCYTGHDIKCTVNYNKIEKLSDTEFKFSFSINVPQNLKLEYAHINLMNLQNICTISNEKGEVLESIWKYECIVTLTQHTETEGYVSYSMGGTCDGNPFEVVLCSKSIWADSVPPTINPISQETLSEWSKSKSITISGTENYCNTVKVEILDDEEDVIFSGTSAVKNGNYSISCTPELEAGLDGRTFKVIVTDNCTNKTEKEFTISKVDSVPPTSTSENKVGEDWAKSKNFTFKAIDHGIGNVQMAFSDISDLQLANFDGTEYSREYQFTGDVYSPKELSVLYKDELGNSTIQRITIDKLDNTAPSITNASIHNNKITLDVNDIKEGLGEGSGVIKYRYITSAEKLENPEIPESATQVNKEDEFIIPNISEVKYVYIVAEDLAGNISEVYEYEAPRVSINQ